MKLLVVDDEPSVRTALERALRLANYEVVSAWDGEGALALLNHTTFDAVVLDVLLPGIDGTKVCRTLRERGDLTPILMLTAAVSVSSRVSGLDSGADDYLTKPFALEELLARVRALLRRNSSQSQASNGAGILEFADLTLDLSAWQVKRGGSELHLTRTEMTLLELFLRNPRQVLTRSILNDEVWGYDFGPASNSLEVYIGYLRRKTEEGGASRLIHTVRGLGYVLREH